MGASSIFSHDTFDFVVVLDFYSLISTAYFFSFYTTSFLAGCSLDFAPQEKLFFCC
jgi:hypothetical protein